MSTLTQASYEWSSRPADERFNSLESLHVYCEGQRNISRTASVDLKTVRVDASDNDLRLIGSTGAGAEFTNWSFGQLSSLVKAPQAYLKDLPSTLAAQCLNHGLKNRIDNGHDTKFLLSQNGGYKLRAITSDRYTRIWNADITSRLIRLNEEHPYWQPAPAAFDGSRGLYAGDRDMFAFMVDSNRRIFETRPGGGLSRGFFTWNSEVGARTFGFTSFLYEYCCGNHRVWGASVQMELKIRHVGSADDKAFRELAVELKKYTEQSSQAEEEKISRAMAMELGKNKEEVLDKIFGLKISGLTQSVVTEGYQKAVEHSDWYGSPRTVWGMAGGITEVARDIRFTDERVQVERAAGKLMEVAF